MPKHPIILPEFRSAYEELKMSPAMVSGDHVFFSGVTGVGANGHMPDDPQEQIRNAFDKLGVVLRHVDLTFDAIVEMTTYHIGLREHFDLFNAIRSKYVKEPYPAWTAVEVAALRRKGAIVEMRVIASIVRVD